MFLVTQDGLSKTIKQVSDNFRPYFYSKHEIVSDRIISKEPIKALNGDFFKYIVKLPSDVVALREMDMKTGNITDYEADFLFARRYVYDNDIQLGTEPLTKCYYDIETQMVKDHFPNPMQDEITFISLCSKDFKVVITWATDKYKYTKMPDNFKLILVKDEEEMLKVFFEQAHNYSMLVGWNSRQFDYPFISERSKRYHLDQHCVNFVWADLLDLYRRFISSYTTGKTPPSNLSLDNVAKYVLGYGKNDKAVEVLQTDDLIRVAGYNLNDSELVEAIDIKSKLTDLVDSFSLTLNLLADDCDYFGKMIELCIMREMRGKFIFKCKTKPTADYAATHGKGSAFFGRGGVQRTGKSKGGIAGAYVHEPPLGIFRDIAVFDFAGLYPNIIRTLNASPETIVDDNSTLPNLITAPELLHKFKPEPVGVFSKFITNLMVLRKEYKRLKAETHDDKYEPLQQMTKYLINAFYGVTAHETSRIYDKRIGESVTATGRYLLKELEKHFNVIYGDTDSVMVPLVTDDHIEEIKYIETAMNGFVIEALAKYNMDGSKYMNIRFEKMFDAVYWYGVKKRYYGRVTIDEDFSSCDHIVSRGLEIRRTDWCKLAVEYESKVLELVLYNPKAALTFHREFVGTIDNQPISKFVIFKTLTKPIGEYKSPPPHVRAANETDWIGTKIGYVVTGFRGKRITSVERVQETTTTMPRPSHDYYYSRQIFPIYKRLLEPLDKSQHKLFI